MATMTPPAPSRVVNRTHRAIRAQALKQQAQKRKVRSLYLPLIFGGVLLIAAMVTTAVILASDSDVEDTLPYASEQIFVLLMWLIPVSAAAIGVVWYKRVNAGRGGNR